MTRRRLFRREHHGSEEKDHQGGAHKPKAKPRRKASAEGMPKMEDVAKGKGKQEFVKVARTKSKKKPRTWVNVYMLMTGPEVNLKKSEKVGSRRKR